MPSMRAERSTLPLIDFQTRLMPAIDGVAIPFANARRLTDVGTPVLFTG
jgi:hypothetical protein